MESEAAHDRAGLVSGVELTRLRRFMLVGVGAGLSRAPGVYEADLVRPADCLDAFVLLLVLAAAEEELVVEASRERM